MKLLKGVLIFIGIIVGLWLILAAFLNKNFEVSRDVTISRTSTEVFDYIRYLKNQDNYSVWNKMDPTMKKSYKGTDGMIGFVASWDSKNENVGKGSQEITAIQDGSRLDTHLRFEEPFESESDAYMTTESKSNNDTKVTWGIKGKIPYPWNIMILFMNMDEEMGPDLEKGLENLKVILETPEQVMSQE